MSSLASHLGILDDEFEELLAAGKLSKIRPWYNNLWLRVQTHRYNYIPWIDLDDAFAPLQWAHLPRHQIIGGIPVLLGFSVQVVARWRSQVERRFDWMQDIDLVSSLSRGW